MYKMDESEENEEEVEGKVIGGGGDEVSIIPVVYPRGTISVSSLGSFSSVGSSSKDMFQPKMSPTISFSSIYRI